MTDPTRKRIFTQAYLLSVIAAAAGTVLAAMLLALWTTEYGGLAAGTARQFIAFAFVTMGAAWLLSPFLLIGRSADGRLTITWASALRWAAVIDAAGLCLVAAAWLSKEKELPWTVGLKLYAILASFAALQGGMAWLLGRSRKLAGPAVAAAIGLAVVACTSLVWGHLAVRALDGGGMALVQYGNPLLAAAGAVGGFDWARMPRMYDTYSVVGERLGAMPRGHWQFASLAYLTVAAWLVAASSAVRRVRRH